jgi:hypothetical protein
VPVETIKCEATSSTNKVDSTILRSEPVLRLERLCETQAEPEFNIEMDSRRVLEQCRSRGLKGVPNCSILSDRSPPPAPPDPPSQRLTKEQLLPPTPSVFLENKKDVFSPILQEFCLKHPIAVVRGSIALSLTLGPKIDGAYDFALPSRSRCLISMPYFHIHPNYGVRSRVLY